MPTDPRQRRAVLLLAVLVLLGGGSALYAYLSRPPQMGASEEVFRTVDALFTAVTARDGKQLDACERRLAGYRQSGELPAAAADALAGIVGTARGGDWQPAAERLYDFMLAQRRDGVIQHAPKPAPKGKAKR